MTKRDPTTLTPSEAEDAISSFSKFLQFETVSATAPNTGAYREASQYLLQQLNSIPCLDKIQCLEEAPDHSPVVVARWKGTDPTLPIILLNSHYDVVPAETNDWTVEPFAGLRKDGRVYGRGAQDMKCVCIQYIQAIRKLNSMEDFQPTRSIYLTFVPDEEIGGSGMAAFLSSKLYKSLPGIALALDEGLASTTDTYAVFYGERLPWWVDVTATGNTGHGSRFIEHTAVEQIVELANKALAFREGQRAALHGSSNDANHMNCSHAVAAKNRRLAKESSGTEMALGDVTSLNITTLEAGVKAGNSFVYNCVPSVAKVRCTCKRCFF
jgi:aminoacylase